MSEGIDEDIFTGIGTDVKKGFNTVIDDFIKHLEAQAVALPLIMELLNAKIIHEVQQVGDFVDENTIKVDFVNNDNDDVTLPEEHINAFFSLSEKIFLSSVAIKLLPVNFVVSYVSQYDAYLGELIRMMFKVKPEMLNSSEKNILFSDLVKFSSIDEAKDFTIEREVEAVLRESHLKQFKWLETKLAIQLRNVKKFNSFIEITERRNLFVHANGVVSRQYLEVCTENNVDNIKTVKLGSKLNADQNYSNTCYAVLFEIGVKLGHVIWRKLLPSDIKKADEHLNSICYNLLVKGHYELAQNLLVFATVDLKKKHSDQESTSFYQINHALAYYLSNKKEDCLKVLSQHDWTASNDKFQLAVAVLKEDYETACRLMKSIGPNNDHLTKLTYKEWPLYAEFRKSEDFKKTFKEVFGEDIIYSETKVHDIEDMLRSFKKLKEKTESKTKEETFEEDE